jgi:hypothetical protein
VSTREPARAEAAHAATAHEPAPAAPVREAGPETLALAPEPAPVLATAPPSERSPLGARLAVVLVASLTALAIGFAPPDADADAPAASPPVAAPARNLVERVMDAKASPAAPAKNLGPRRGSRAHGE